MVTTLVDGEEVPGYHSVTWDGRNARGELVASGLYFVRMRAPGISITKKVLLLK